VFGQRLLYYLHVNFDKVLIGRLLGPAALGVYGLASSVILVPFSRIAVPVAEVLFPAFSRMQGDRRQLAETWIRASRLIGAVSLPALVGLAVVAPDFVQVVLGAEWRAAAPVIQALALVGALQSLQTLNSAILQAVDRTGTLLRYSLVFFGAHAVAFVVGIQWGILGVAVCYAISSSIVEPLYAWLTARALEIPVWSFFRGVAGVAQATIAVALVTLAARMSLEAAGVSAAARLLLTIGLGTAALVPLVLWRAPEVADELRRLRRQGEQLPAQLLEV
jgi:O-antigen/teichoic acid export membrane protein